MFRLLLFLFMMMEACVVVVVYLFVCLVTRGTSDTNFELINKTESSLDLAHKYNYNCDETISWILVSYTLLFANLFFISEY